MKKINGFTLAEVLLTLAIIGVVAAMTIPTLIMKEQNEQYVAGFRKAHEVLTEATARISDDNFDDPYSAFDSNGVLNTYAKYLNIAKNCGSGTGCLPGKVRVLNGATALEDWDAENDGYGEKAILADGMCMDFLPAAHSDGHSPIATVLLDINGKNDPNILGLDIFEFEIFEDGKVLPMGHDETDEVIASECSSTGPGMYCGMRILNEGAINYSKGSSSGTFEEP